MGNRLKNFLTDVFPLALFCLLVFAIPIEHKYDKFLRFYSLKLIPEGLILPDSFEKKIYCYPSDIIALFLFGVSLWTRGKRIWEKGGVFLGAMLLCAVLSILLSPMKNYSVLYIRLWQLATPMALFFFVANGPVEGKKIFRLGCASYLASAFFQSLIALAQYGRQEGFGWRLLSEQSLAAKVPCPPSHMLCSLGGVADAEGIFRAMGTMPHPNVLGGFLALALLLMLGMFSARRWWLFPMYAICLAALACTYSRSAIYAWAMGTVLWMVWRKTRLRLPVWGPLALLGSCTLLVGGLFAEQYLYRGGIVSYTPSIRESDQERLYYQKAAVRMMGHAPWFGVGFGQFSCQNGAFLDPEVSQKLAAGGVHNIFLRIGAEMGIFALKESRFPLEEREMGCRGKREYCPLLVHCTNGEGILCLD